MKLYKKVIAGGSLAFLLSLGVAPATQAAPVGSLDGGTVSPMSYTVMGIYPSVRACVTAAERRFPNQSYWSCRSQPNGKWYLYANDGRTD